MKPNEVALMDKAYNNYKLFDQWNKSDIYFFTRLKNNAQEELIEVFEFKPASCTS